MQTNQQFLSRLINHGTKVSLSNYHLSTNYVFDTDKQAQMCMNKGQMNAL